MNWRHLITATMSLALCSEILGQNTAFSAETIENSAAPVILENWNFKFSETQRIPHLSWNKKSARLRVIRSKDGKSERKYIEIIGQYTGDRAKILIERQETGLSKDGRFLLRSPVQNRSVPIEIILVEPTGKVTQEKVTVEYTPSKTAQNTPKLTEAAPQRRFLSTVGGGVTNINYSQTGSSAFSQISLNAKGGLVYFPKNSRMEFGISGFYTGMALKAAQTPEMPTVAFLGINARVGYRIPITGTPWTFTISGGYYYASAVGSVVIDETSSGLGYSVSGLQAFLVASRMQKSGARIGSYFKFSPVSDTLAFQFISREIAGGLNYTFKPNADGRAFGMGIDLSNLKITILDSSADVSTATLGASYYF